MSSSPKTKAPPVPVPRPQEPEQRRHTPNPRAAEDLRWQRTVRFNWDKGGSKGGRK